MKRILHVLGGLDRGGAESFVMNTARTIDKSKYKLTIATFLPPQNGKEYAYQEELNELGIKVIKIPDTRFSHPAKFANAVRRIIRSENIDVLHSHIDLMSALTLWGAFLGGVKHRIAHSHNTNNQRLNSGANVVVASFLRFVIKILATEKISCGCEAGDFLFGKHAKVTVIPNGIDVQKFMFSKKARAALRKQYKISPEATVLLNVGRLEAQKNQLYLLDIFDLYLKKHPQAYLFIVGDGSLKADLEKRCEELKLAKRVFLVPALGNINEYYSLADFFVLPSLFEGVPIVGIEAQASGLKCVLSDRTPAETALVPGTKFVGINPEDLNTWVETISEPLPTSARVKQNTDAKIMSYDITKTVKKLEKIYAAK